MHAKLDRYRSRERFPSGSWNELRHGIRSVDERELGIRERFGCGHLQWRSLIAFDNVFAGDDVIASHDSICGGDHRAGRGGQLRRVHRRVEV